MRLVYFHHPVDIPSADLCHVFLFPNRPFLPRFARGLLRIRFSPGIPSLCHLSFCLFRFYTCWSMNTYVYSICPRPTPLSLSLPNNPIPTTLLSLTTLCIHDLPMIPVPRFVFRRPLLYTYDEVLDCIMFIPPTPPNQTVVFIFFPPICFPNCSWASG